MKRPFPALKRKEFFTAKRRFPTKERLSRIVYKRERCPLLSIFSEKIAVCRQNGDKQKRKFLSDFQSIRRRSFVAIFFRKTRKSLNELLTRS
jgi:hypothetical protein